MHESEINAFYHLNKNVSSRCQALLFCNDMKICEALFRQKEFDGFLP